MAKLFLKQLELSRKVKVKHNHSTASDVIVFMARTIVFVGLIASAFAGQEIRQFYQWIGEFFGYYVLLRLLSSPQPTKKLADEWVRTVRHYAAPASLIP